MSKLAKAIDYTFTGDVRASRNHKLNYTDVSLKFNQIGIDKQYKLIVKLETHKWFNDDHFIASNEYPDAIRQECLRDIKRAMIEEVFGEFRPLIIEMRSALYDHDTTRLRSLLSELENSMFHDGL